MKLTVLGNNGPFPGKAGACSGYLIEEDGTRVLIDCGNGVLANLQRFIALDALDAIILTHLHSDHMSDMMVLRYAIQIKRKRGQIDRLLSVYAPEEPVEDYKRLDVKDAFVLQPLNATRKLSVGKLSFSFAEMKHPVKTFAVSVDNGAQRFVFSGDTAWTQTIVDFSKGANLIMLDSGLLTRDKVDNNVPHMTAAECGKAAALAGVGKLLLTHFWPEYDLNELLAEAKQHFENVELTEILKSYEI